MAKIIKVKGMSCQHCANAVIKALNGIDGVSGAAVDLTKGEASFEEARSVDEAVIRETIKKAGYELG